ncbi:lysozyme [Qipengyuania nanhaisediminis]|uniref:lysozyme n=1 Tax=Qipengyuania nanhaisediminis TaxID=604088 RepID=UPI0038B3EDEA
MTADRNNLFAFTDTLAPPIPRLRADTVPAGRVSAAPGASGNPAAAADIETTRKLARRRFLRTFRERFRRHRQARNARREERSAARLDRDRSGPSARPRRRRHKRTALALGMTSLSLAGTSQMALSADPIAAASIPSPDPAALEPADPSERRDANDLSVSDNLLDALVEEEGVRYDVYKDVAGYPTVGVGHLVLPRDNLRLGDTISHERAIRLLENDLKKAEDGVRRLVGNLPINQHEFDALADLVFNVGEGTVSAAKSPRLNAAIAAGDYEKIADQLHYTTARNKVARGLIYRSERRAQIFLSGEYGDPREKSEA